MIFNCKAIQPPHLPYPNQSPYLVHSQKADHSSSGTPKQQQFQNCSDTRKACVQPENCQFKIRTFSTRSSNKRTSIEGKYLKNVLVIQGNKRVKLDSREAVTIVTNKCLEGQKHSRNYIMRSKKQNKNDAVFNSISIVKTNDKKSITFNQQDNSYLKPLAHKPFIKLNQAQIEQPAESLVVIVSLRCLINEAVKYWRNNDKGFYSQKSVGVQASELSLQTINLLRILSGSASKEGWLSQCRLFYKAHNSRQMDLVYDYLIDNKLLGFAGVLNCQKKAAESYRIYSVESIVGKDMHILLVEDYESLQKQFPLLQGHRFACISPKAANYANIYPFVNCLKDASFQINSKKSHLQSCTHIDIEKENIDINLYAFTQQNCQSQPSSYCKIQKPSKCSKIQLSIGVNLQKDFIHLQSSKLIQMVKQTLKIRQIRKTIKQVRQRSVQNRIPSAQYASKGNSLIRERHKFKDQSTIGDEQSPQIGKFQGQFKDKLVKLVKILQNEKKQLRMPRKSSFQLKRQTDTQGKRQQNDLQFITESITSRLKCKTGYQLVGDLVKSNMHINRQINKYLSNTKGLEQYLGLDKRCFLQNADKDVQNVRKITQDSTTNQKRIQDLPIYYF